MSQQTVGQTTTSDVGIDADALHRSSWEQDDGPLASLDQIKVVVERMDEPAVTALLGVIGEAGEKSVLRFLGLNPPPEGTDLVVLDGDTWKRRRKEATGKKWRTDRRVPDLVVADRARGYRAVVVVEVKGRAWVNGAWGYCPHEPQGYSNQVSCYLHGCWADDEELESARFVCLHGYDESDPLAGRGLKERHIEVYGLGAELERQQKDFTSWQPLRLQDLAAELGEDPFADLIWAWLRKIDLA